MAPPGSAAAARQRAAAKARQPVSMSADAEAARSTDVEAVLAPLRGLCATKEVTLKSAFWTFEYCVHGSVRQHRTYAQRSDDRSLGTFVRAELAPAEGMDIGTQPQTAAKGGIARGSVSTSAGGGARGGGGAEAAPAILERFEGGDVSEESGRARNTTVFLRCCGSARVVGAPALSLARAREPRDGEFELEACAPAMCDVLPGPTAIDLLEKAMRKGGVGGEGRCMAALSYIWWTYKFCYDKGIQQLHLTEPRADGILHVYTVETEYWLGRYSAALGRTTDDDLIVEQPDGRPSVLQLEYEGGTPCDSTAGGAEEGDHVRGQLRSSTVQFVCGDTEALRSVAEDHTCHYQVVVTRRSSDAEALRSVAKDHTCHYQVVHSPRVKYVLVKK
ncbi:hypothetical protein JKP88DRAFT_295991 [Tribonema minus]|uniref:MRH domain-containing protein n=1 Tax=Tribonema minus TaxID=303371 RepID=A0A836CLX1_9STRA|nr:hypothetical protein JKP88DRAFT_295991 [Tribonema minus]